MTKLFLSYRRSDSESITRRIHKALESHFGGGNVFIDADLGAGDFLINVMAAINNADACIVVIGTGWLNATDPKTGERRLFQIKDVVRREVEQALVRPLTVMILVQGASVPAKEALPETIDHLPKMNAFTVRDDEHLEADVTRIARKINQFLYPPSAATAPAPVIQAPPAVPRAVPFDVFAAIDDYFNLFDAQKFEQAREVLTQIRASGRVPKFFDLSSHEAENTAALAAVAAAQVESLQRAERDQEYGVLRRMAARPNPRGLWESLQIFWQTHPGHDPDNLARLRPRTPIATLLPAPFALIAIPGSTGKTWTGAPASPCCARRCCSRPIPHNLRKSQIYSARL